MLFNKVSYTKEGWSIGDFKTMRGWFAVPTVDGEYQNFAYRILHYTLLLLIGLAIIFLLFATSVVQLIFIPAVLALLGVCYYLLHSHRFYLARVLFLSGLWLLLTITALTLNGIRNAGVGSFAIIIIFAAILISERAVIVFTGLSILSLVILAVGETQGVLPLYNSPLFLPDRFFQHTALFLSACILLAAASRVIRSSFLRIQSHEHLLLEQNRALEKEIEARQRTEATLRASEEKYRLLFENTSVLSAVYKPDGTIELCNRAGAQFFSTTPEAIQGRNIAEFLTSHDATLFIEQLIRVSATGAGELDEGQTTLPDGREICYLQHFMPLPAVESPVAALDKAAQDRQRQQQVLVLTTDVTQQKQNEQRTRELALANERNLFLTEFFSTISHDLKTPITVLNTHMYLLEHNCNDAQRERLAQMKKQIGLLDKYIQDMLMISRLEFLPTLNLETLQLNPLIEEVIALLRPRLEKKNIEYHVSTPPNLPVVQADAEQMQRVVLNLVENAVNYTPANGRIRVSTQPLTDRVLVEVSDSGIGIQDHDLSRIFERFYRAHEARSAESSGTGLGLSIVKKIIDMHQGTIEVESKPGVGTAFRIYLPVH
jgi:PAS domain S-box-containing protein